MKNVLLTNHVPIKMWFDSIEEEAMNQAKNIANLPFIFKHFAMMPDSHVGYGMPIGGVLATQGVIIPNAVGVDIGCGMCAVRTSMNELDIKQLKKVLNVIRELVPVGFEHHKERQDEQFMPQRSSFDDIFVVKHQYISALKQIGTLGGGNHFIEIQRAADGHIWIMIHSGSRNLGLKVAEHYNKKAQQLNQMYFSQVPVKADLAFLPIKTDEAHQYYEEMKYCVEFAFANRRLMMENIQKSFQAIVSGVNFEPIINIAHNYARWENHFGENVLVHRKGATSAQLGEIGIIPGSQGTKSYIVEGLGNVDSFQSCSHGAGRKLSRSKAVKQLDLGNEIELMNQQGIIHGIRTAKDLDEAPGAYKNIDEVMQNQQDLVKILVELKPLAVIKG